MATVADEVSALARVRNRRLFIEDRRRFDDAVARLEDRYDYEISVRRLYANRSQKQNKYYWSVVVELLSQYSGSTPDETHDWLKMMFIPKKLAVCDGNGEIVGEFVLGGSTRKLNTTQFEEYMRDIREWAAIKLDVVIPDPDPHWRGGDEAVGQGYGHGV